MSDLGRAPGFGGRRAAAGGNFAGASRHTEAATTFMRWPLKIPFDLKLT